ncbi:MAG: CrcB protein [Candidatus Azotimanducaceae bacterium]|jgi:CrcB protein
MGIIVAIALGGALGSLARHGFAVWLEQLLGRDFPYGVFIANIVGSALMGLCFILLVEKTLLSEFWRTLIMVGFLGAFTTFSTYSVQSLALLQDGRLGAAAIYILGSVVLSLTGAYGGILLGRSFTN